MLSRPCDTIVCIFAKHSYNNAMQIEAVVKHFGSVAQVAERLGVTPMAIYQWYRRGEIPAPRQYQLQVLSNGALRVASEENGAGQTEP